MGAAAEAVLKIGDSAPGDAASDRGDEPTKFGPLRKFLETEVLENEGNKLARKNLLGLRPCMVKTTSQSAGDGDESKGGDTASFRTYWVSYANYDSFKEMVESDPKKQVVDVPPEDAGDGLFAAAQEKAKQEENDAGPGQGAQTANLSVAVNDARPAHAQTTYSQGGEGRRCTIM